MSDVDYIAQAEKAYKEALDIVRNKEGWSTEKEDKKNQIIVQMKKNAQGRKIYLCTAKVNIPAKLLIQKIKDSDSITSWNKTLLKSETLKRISDTVGITYQMTTDAAGGMVSSRDFVYLYKIGQEGDSWVMGGESVDYKEAPSSNKIVRAVNGPGLQMVTPTEESDWCEVIWLMDCTYNGMMLQRILDIALPLACTSYIECIRNLSAEMKKNGAF